jgi:hypothetical protein
MGPCWCFWAGPHHGVFACGLHDHMITRFALVAFAIEKYSDEVMCDVVPIHASHLLLGGVHGNSIGRQFMMCLEISSLL